MRGIIFQLEESRGHIFYYHIELVRDNLCNKDSSVILRTGRTNLSLSLIEPNLLQYKEKYIQVLKEKLWTEFLIAQGDKKSKSLMCVMNDHNEDVLTFRQNTFASKMFFL